MRTTLNLDTDVAAMLERERRRTGETLGQVASRLLRRAAAPRADDVAVSLPVIPGTLQMDVSDVSAALARLDDDARDAREDPGTAA
jgi:hypothetical protein